MKRWVAAAVEVEEQPSWLTFFHLQIFKIEIFLGLKNQGQIRAKKDKDMLISVKQNRKNLLKNLDSKFRKYT